MMHVDISKMLETEGFKVTELSSGQFKTEWSPFKPLSEDAIANMQPRLEAVHQDFLNAVMNGRGGHATEDIRTQRFGEGRMFSASDALTHGMVDRVQSPADFYRAVMPPQEQEATKTPYGFPQRARLEVERRRY
jgi:ClpP class serine protease